MEITFLGQAGLFIETKHGSILCDPWFNPAYFASWFPFPSNEPGRPPVPPLPSRIGAGDPALDLEKLARPTYLYVSHQHYDHFDPQFLREHVWKEATVLLPDYPINLLERALREVGFSRFLYTKNGQALEVDGLRFMILAMVAPVDGPLGDSGLMVDDGEVRIFDQNDSRPIDLEVLARHGPYDAHFVQFSGAIWYPMVYQYPEKMLQALGRKKRENEMARALRYIQQVNASFVVPSAGPPCFLDDHLFSFNDFDRDPSNTFPDQTVFLEYMQEHGLNNGRLMIPGSVATLSRAGDAPGRPPPRAGASNVILERSEGPASPLAGRDDPGGRPSLFEVVHPMSDEQVRAIFTHKRAYLEAYKARKQPEIDAIKASWPRGQVDILSGLREWFEPLLEVADLTCVGVNDRVLLDLGEQKIVIDFHLRRVYAWDGEEYGYSFRIDPALIEYCIMHHVEDWVNLVFLSCRFEASRKGPYNEYIYNFFKCLSLERLQYAEGYYVEKAPEQQLWESHGYRIQRRCPHLKGDLARFAHIENGILTCTMHGWQFELATGRCLTSEGHRLYAQPITPSDVKEGAATAEPGKVEETAGVHGNEVEEKAVQYIRNECSHCWYVPSRWPGSAESKKPR